MGTGISRKQVEVSEQFKANVEQIYKYGFEMFGYFQAKRYKQNIQNYLSMLSDFYNAFPVCRHLATKSRTYRNIILDSHLIIYRIKEKRIEVLDIVHPVSNIRRIREVRSIRL